AMAFPVLYRTKDALAEQAVLLRLERPVVDRLGLENFAPGPPVTQAGHCKPLALLGVLRAADLLWRGDPDLDVVERRRARLARIAKINHSLLPAPVAAAVTLSGDEAVTLGVHPGGEPGFVGTHSYVDTKRLQLLHENVERLWRSRLRQVLSLHNRFINLATTVHVVRLDGEDLLQGVCGAIRFQRPHFHLSETLAAELCLAGQWLLRNQWVRPDAARVNLVVDKVRQLEHVDRANRNRRVERLAAAAIAQTNLSARRDACQTNQLRRSRVDVEVLRLDRGRERRKLLTAEQRRRAGCALLLETLQLRLERLAMQRCVFLIRHRSLVERELSLQLRLLTCNQILRCRRDEVPNASIDRLRSSATTLDSEIVERRIGQQLRTRGLRALRLDVVQQDAHLVVRHPEVRAAQLQRVTYPGERGKLQQHADLALVRTLEHRRLGVEAEQLRGPPEVGLENLSDVHTARNAERVQNDVHGPSIREERHVLLGNDAGNDTLVAVSSGHLVTNRDLTLLGHVNLHELDHARWQLIRLQHAVDPLFCLLFDLRLLVVCGVDDDAHALVQIPILDAKRLEIESGEVDFIEYFGRETCSLRNRLFHRTRLECERDRLAREQIQQLAVTNGVHANLLETFNAPDLSDALAAILIDDLIFNTREDLDVYDYTFHSRWHLERGVLHILRLLAEDCGQKLLFWRQLRFALWRDLADENVARLDVRTDTNDSALIEIRECFLGDVRNFLGDFFLAALRVANVQLELLDVDRRIHVVLHQTLAQHDCILEVVSVPRHERYRDVRAERELALFRGRTVGEYVAGRNLLAAIYQRSLIDRGVLVGAPVLLDLVPVVLRQTRERPIAVLLLLSLIRVDDDLVRGDARYHTCTQRYDDRAGIARDLLLQSGTAHRRTRIEERNCLTLHVRAHQRAVGVVVLEERNERRCDRDELLGRDVHVIDTVWRRERHVATLTAQHQLIHERTVRIERRICLRDDRTFLTVGVEPRDFLGDLLVLHHEVRRLDEAEIVHTGKCRERRDESDVRTFRRLDRTHAAVLRVVHVAHFEARALACETTRSERRKTTLVRQLGERIRLIHELRQLRRTEERLDHRRNGARVHEIVERDLFRIGIDRHALLDQARHA